MLRLQKTFPHDRQWLGGAFSTSVLQKLQDHQTKNSSTAVVADWGYRYDNNGHIMSQALANVVGQGGRVRPAG
jgi:hypothetical protein